MTNPAPDTKPGKDNYLGISSRRREAGAFSLEYWIADRGGDGVKSHGHRDAHVMYVMGDSYITNAAGRPAHNHSSLVYNPPATHHRDRLTRPGRFFTITALGEQMPSLCDLGLPGDPNHVAGPAAYAIVGRLIRECAGWQPDSALGAEALCFELLAAIAAPHAGERTMPAWLHTARDMLESNISATLTIADLSRAVNVHPVHLTRTFRAFHGCTPGEYLRGRRLERAADILSATRRPLAEIALATGFADQSHFSRQFQHAVGVTPTVYRRLTGRAH